MERETVRPYQRELFEITGDLLPQDKDLDTALKCLEVRITRKMDPCIISYENGLSGRAPSGRLQRQDEAGYWKMT